MCAFGLLCPGRFSEKGQKKKKVIMYFLLEKYKMHD